MIMVMVMMMVMMVTFSTADWASLRAHLSIGVGNVLVTCQIILSE